MFENEKTTNAAFNHQIAFENELKRCIKYRQFYNTARKNTLSRRSHQLFNIFFLPTIEISPALKDYKFGLYFQQILTLFQSEVCSSFAKIHVSKVVMKIYERNITGDQ